MGIAICGCILQLIVFKTLYPFPDFQPDSLSYIDANIYNMDASIYPIAYSKFLLFIHSVSHSDTLLIGVQYLLLQSALGYFFFSICYLYQPLKGTKTILFLVLLFNPLFLFVANTILPDALFTALSIVFFTQFLWMFHKPTIEQVLLQAILAGLAFTLNDSAAVYPLVTIAGLLLSRQRTALKTAGILATGGLMLLYYIHITQKTQELTGRPQYSVLSSWMMANNALYMYRFIKVDTTQLPPDLVEVNKSARHLSRGEYPTVDQFEGPYFIKTPTAVLQPYAQKRFPFQDLRSAFVSWTMVSGTIHKYGLYLAEHYPLEFARYYLLPNTQNYFLPNQESLTLYNQGKKTVHDHVQDWFDYITPDIAAASFGAQGKICYVFPILFMVLNIYFFGSLLWHSTNGNFKRFTPLFKVSLILLLVYLLVNAIISIAGAPIAFRQQLTPFILLCAFCLLLLEFPDNGHQFTTTKKPA